MSGYHNDPTRCVPVLPPLCGRGPWRSEVKRHHWDTAQLGLTSKPGPESLSVPQICNQNQRSQRVSDLCLVTANTCILCTPPGQVNPSPGSRPNEKGPGDPEKMLGFSLPTHLCSQLGVLILPLLGIWGLSAEVPTGTPSDQERGQAAGGGLWTGGHIWATNRFALPRHGVATIPARSSLEDTSLGELLPGSILSDSLKTKVFTRSDRLSVSEWTEHAHVCTGAGRLHCC